MPAVAIGVSLAIWGPVGARALEAGGERGLNGTGSHLLH
jgi:hypothetical protein